MNEYCKLLKCWFYEYIKGDSMNTSTVIERFKHFHMWMPMDIQWTLLINIYSMRTYKHFIKIKVWQICTHWVLFNTQCVLFLHCLLMLINDYTQYFFFANCIPYINKYYVPLTATMIIIYTYIFSIVYFKNRNINIKYNNR